jgi:hypothetical protein
MPEPYELLIEIAAGTGGGAARGPARCRAGAGERVCSEGHPYGEEGAREEEGARPQEAGAGREDGGAGQEDRPGLVIHRPGRRHSGGDLGRFGVTVDGVRRLDPAITDPNVIQVGQVIRML